ncbi:MAG: hypothetical protein ACR2MP_33640 [Streptosporangiaceae bacterium]
MPSRRPSPRCRVLVPYGLWLWAVGCREPPRAARVQAAAFFLDALDECQTAGEEKAGYAAASEALSADIRPVARPSVMHVDIDPASPSRCQAGWGMSVVGGCRFLVTEVSCGCRRHFYLDLHSLIVQAAAAPPGGPAGRAHVPPLPPDLPARERQRLVKSPVPARA